jgi:lipoate-protein ligase A
LILGRLIDALAVPGLTIRGISDLAMGERKVSGNSQRRSSRALLHHGTLLYAFEAATVERYLMEPYRQPDYRSGRCHADFLGNLPLPAGEIRDRLHQLFSGSDILAGDASAAPGGPLRCNHMYDTSRSCLRF